MKIAIVGSGISGLAAAHRLREVGEITLFEANDYFGGHTHTVDLTLPGAQGDIRWGVDTGFLVFNERTYPQLIELFKALNIRTVPTDMSFSVQVAASSIDDKLEWSGTNLHTVFCQKRNWFNPKFWGMLKDLIRFNRICTQLAQSGEDQQLAMPLSEFLDEYDLGSAFREWYLLPMLGCIWSCPTDQMLAFPVATMIRFCHNHGLLQILNRPQWWTVYGGAKHYVDKIIAGIPHTRLNCPVQRVERDDQGVWVHSSHGKEHFDHIILATHSDQSLALLSQPSPLESTILGAIRYQPNVAVVHTDTRVLPSHRSAWAAWNYENDRIPQAEQTQRVCLHYWINQLQPVPFEQNIIETLNPVKPIAPEHVLHTFEYSHPIFDGPAIEAQRRLHEIQGNKGVWFCGAWTGYGFHEDGLTSGYDVAHQLIHAQGVPA